MNDWAALDRALVAMASSSSAEVREDGGWLAEFSKPQCEMCHDSVRPLVHLWSAERNLTRSILRVREQTGDRIVLEVRRFGRAKPGEMEFLRTDLPRAAACITRDEFRARLQRARTGGADSGPCFGSSAESQEAAENKEGRRNWLSANLASRGVS